ncbi:MAG: hypothetical protein R2809_06550 [Flavobacteriales bacterium]
MGKYLKVFFIVFTALICSSSNGQIIDNRLGKAFSEEMYFNQEFLWQNKIKKITGVLSIKRPSRPIEQRPDVYVYKINQVGLLEELDKVTSVLHLVDSLTIQYKRNDLGEVELRTEQGNRGFYTKKFFYNKEGKVERLDYGKSENLSTQKGKLEAGQTITINSESYSYNHLSDTVVMKSCYNNYGLLYSNITTVINKLGYLVSEKEVIVMSNRSITQTYKYNEKGWLEEIVIDSPPMSVKRQKYYYDELGNLLKMERYLGDEMIQEVEVLYTETMLIEAYLDHDIRSHDIIITKFTYEFY